MIRITQIKLPVGHGREALEQKISRALHIRPSRIGDFQIVRRGIDARSRDDLKYVYTVNVSLKNEDTYTIGKHKNIMFTEPVNYAFPCKLDKRTDLRPVIIGSGPAGLFCAFMLSENGFYPLVVERGSDIDKRTADVASFWAGGPLDTSSNVQFGEGGAGTFSDGKLNTGVSDRTGRVSEVLKIFTRFGGDPEILYDAAPHLGSDALKKIVKNIRNHIVSCGGEFLFDTCVSDIEVSSGRLTGLITERGEKIKTDLCILAPGHSARDTFLMLKRHGLLMEPKAFSAGLRAVHPQKLINESQWGENYPESLGAAAYKLSAKTKDGRGVYTFCMCPGGYVVNASSEDNMLAVNGMSYSGRASGFANSAVVSGVTPEDYFPYADDTFNEELSGVAFQRMLESRAFHKASGAIPVQEYADFRAGQKRQGDALYCVKGDYACADLSDIFPENIYRNILSGMEQFGKMIKGFDGPFVPLLGVESRTSSPVRIVRDENFESSVKGLYPCGEGAGYAGGITSAAVDGIKVAEAAASRILADLS